MLSPCVLLLVLPLVTALCPPTLDRCICTGDNVRCYGVQFSSIPRVPPSTRLLDLRHNDISKLEPGNFVGLSQLRTLLLQFNRINRITVGAFQPLTNLEALYLSNNMISSLTSNLFIGLTGIRIIHLDNNQISSVDQTSFAGLTLLSTLYLHENLLTSVSGDTFSSLDDLTRLRLDGNPLLCNCQLGWAPGYRPLNGTSGNQQLVCDQPGDLTGRLIMKMSPDQFGCSLPQAVIPGDHVTVGAGEQLMLHCRVTGEPHPQVVWNHNDDVITNSSRTIVMPNATLIVMTITTDDVGQYECQAVNLMGSSVANVLVSYRGETVAPEITSHSADSEVHRGGTITLRCTARGHPVPMVTWLKNRQLIVVDGRISQPTTSTLRLTAVEFSDEGTYTCQASNSEGVDQEEIDLTVVSAPLFEHSSPMNTIALSGGNVVLTCRAIGKPTPSLIWRFDGVVITANEHYVISGDQLEIRQFRDNDQGSYSCDAINKLGFDRRRFTVFIERLRVPVFTTLPGSQYIALGHTLMLTCKAVGYISPNQWTHNETLLSSGGRITVSRSGDMLTIRNITFIDSGAYRCSAFGGGKGLATTAPAVISVTTGVLSCRDISSKVRLEQIAREVDSAIKNTTTRLMANRRHTPSDLLTLIKLPSNGTVDLARATEIFDEAVERLESNFTGSGVTGIPLHLSDCELAVLANLSGCATPRAAPNCSDICFHQRYRSADGTCNNLRHPVRGASGTPFGRLLDSDYDNDLSLPRGWIKSLPSPRKISHDILSSRGKELREDAEFTLMLMQIGQFLDHDLDIAPLTPSRDSFKNGVSCEETCENTSPCFPIPVPEDDARIRNRECLPLTRSGAVCGTGTSSLLVGRAAYRREQINQLTSYVDASNIYGSTQDKADLLRDKSIGKGMLLRGDQSTPGHYFLPFDTSSNVDCEVGTNTGTCFLAGDVRVNEQVGLTSMHTIWMREHNRVAELLSQLNPHWDEERLYQETRLVVTAEWQHIVFTEYVPKILGVDQWEAAGSYQGYDDDVDVSIVNSFATAAYRFGHSQIMPVLLRLNETWQTSEYGPLSLRNAFFAPRRLLDEGGVDPILRGLVVEQAKERASDQALSAEITEHLFQQANDIALDLGALNIQRGRDHGLPSYNRFREYCGLSVARDFNDLAEVISRRNVRRKLSEVYTDVNDIDLFVGGILEDLVPGGRLGPTFTCIIRTQFQRLRDGDRFYYEKPGLFTPEQLAEIKKTSLAKVICSNADNITSYPSDVFVHQPVDQFVSCDQLDTPNLFYWKECSECKHDQRRSVRSEPFDFGNPQINTAYQQLQDTVQLLNDKVIKMERKCHYNNVAYNNGDSWGIPPCHHCVCKDGAVKCEHVSCDCNTSPPQECCPDCITSGQVV